VHTSVTVPPNDRDGLEGLARHVLRAPVSLERLRVGEDAQATAYAGRKRAGHEPQSALAPLDPKEFLARVLIHIPEPRRHVLRCCGAYSSVVRARRALQAAAMVGSGSMVTPPPAEQDLVGIHGVSPRLQDSRSPRLTPIPPRRPLIAPQQWVQSTQGEKEDPYPSAPGGVLLCLDWTSECRV
jgi:hypothetical protein